MPNGNTNIHKKINVSGFINKQSLIVFCEFKLVVSSNEGKTIILVRSFQIPK